MGGDRRGAVPGQQSVEQPARPAERTEHLGPRDERRTQTVQ
jgi:hypothetical protein